MEGFKRGGFEGTASSEIAARTPFNQEEAKAIGIGAKMELLNDRLRLLWATVNRTTRSGHIIGPPQRLTVKEALHAMTLGGAYQYFEEDSKGSITVGKQADLVILAENPLTVEPNRLKDIAIVETFSRGRSVCCD